MPKRKSRKARVVCSSVISQWNAIDGEQAYKLRAKRKKHEEPESCAGCGLAWCGTPLCPSCDRHRIGFATGVLVVLAGALRNQGLDVLAHRDVLVFEAFEMADAAMAERRKRINS